jgi:hypothetical protein
MRCSAPGCCCAERARRPGPSSSASTRASEACFTSARHKAAAVVVGAFVGFVLGVTSAGSGALIAVGLILISGLSPRAWSAPTSSMPPCCSGWRPALTSWRECELPPRGQHPHRVGAGGSGRESPVGPHAGGCPADHSGRVLVASGVTLLAKAGAGIPRAATAGIPSRGPRIDHLGHDPRASWGGRVPRAPAPVRSVGSAPPSIGCCSRRAYPRQSRRK